MDLLESVIQNLAKEEIRAYKLFAGRTVSNEGRKDLLLFDALKKNPELSYIEISKKLLPEISDNAYYRLRNRLFSDISKTLTWLYSSQEPVFRSINLLLLGRIYSYKNLHAVSLNVLKKAEKEARGSHQYELLDLIYGDLIRVTAEGAGKDPGPYIKKRRNNHKDLDVLRQTEEILAVVSHRLRISQNFSSEHKGISGMLEKTVNEFSADRSLSRNPKLRIKIFKVASQFLLGKRDYKNLEKYLSETLRKFEKGKVFTKETHDVKLQMLTYLANAAFKNKNYKTSLEYAQKLNTAMKQFKGFLNDKYEFFYHNALVINYSVTNKDKAIDLLESLKGRKFPPGQEFYRIFIPLNLAVLWFDKSEFKKSIRYLSGLYLESGFQESDVNLRFKIAVAELIIRFELSDEEVFNYRINQIKKEFAPQLRYKEFSKERELLQVLMANHEFNEIRQNEKFCRKRDEFIKKWDTGKEDDSEVIQYIPWLKSKV